MSAAQLMDRLRELGWYLTEHGFEVISDYGGVTDIQKIIKRATEHDLKEIGSGEGDLNQANVVVQIQKVRNISAPKHNEESRGAPRMLKLSLTDGKNSYQAVEVENLSSISLNTPPGTKLLLKGGTMAISHGVILLKPLNIVQVLGGKVTSLVEKWELNKKLASHSRVRPVEEGGPPPWIPFGKKIIKVTEPGKNFKALVEKEKPVDENAEFETQRKNAIAEAARQGSKKVFGGGNKQLLDHSVQRIVDQGFTIEQAEHALKVCRNNVDRALKSLQRDDRKSNSAREPREQREPKGKRGEKKSDEVSSKPSSGRISLFDFLEDKLPAQFETTESNNAHSDTYGKGKQENYSDRHHSKGNDRNDYSQHGRGERNFKSTRGYQVPPRHQEDNRPNKFCSNSTGNQQHGQFGGGVASQKTKPPRFQRNQNQNHDVANFNQEFTNHHVEPIGIQNKFPQISVFRNALPNIAPFPQPRQDAATPRDYQTNIFKQSQQDFPIQNQQDYQTKIFSNTRNQSYGANHLPQNQMQEIDPRLYQSSMLDQNYREHQPNTFYGANNDFQGVLGMKDQKNDSYHNTSFNCNNRNDELLGGTWVWRVGDRCMAKYWEDNMYYNAEVTAVSARTCVVQFKDFHNYEEVLQVDCIPITDDDPYVKSFGQDMRRPDHRASGRPPRFEQSQMNANTTEYRRGGNGNAANKNYKKRNQQRGSQPIYQPPAQRGAPLQTAFLPQNT